MGTLYIVSTPIGNLQDITVRAAKLLTDIEYIACEDTRHTGLLLEHLRKTYLQNPLLIKKPRLISFYDDNEEKRIPEIIEILKNGNDVALVSDAGTPGISDPGFTLVRACVKQGIRVSGLPGPSSVTLALVLSGLPTDKFLFLGYLPKKEGNAIRLLESLKENQKNIKATHIFFESPHRLIKSLELIKKIFGDIEIVLCRELTKLHEEIIRGTINSVLFMYERREPRGEYVLLFHS